MASPLDHDHVRYLRGHHALLRLLAAGNPPLIVGFLQRVFIAHRPPDFRQIQQPVCPTSDQPHRPLCGNGVFIYREFE